MKKLENMTYAELVELEKRIKEQKNTIRTEKALYKSSMSGYLNRIGLKDVLETCFKKEGFSNSSGKHYKTDGTFYYDSDECYRAYEDCRVAILKVADYACGNYYANKRRVSNSVKVTPNNMLVKCDTETYKRCVNDISDIIKKYVEERQKNRKYANNTSPNIEPINEQKGE